MAFQVDWTLHAQEDYNRVVNYLIEEWSLEVASDFINNVEKRFQNLSSFPHIGIASVKDPSIRSIVLTKHNKLYYRIGTEKIEILDIFGTRQMPVKNRYE